MSEMTGNTALLAQVCGRVGGGARPAGVPVSCCLPGWGSNASWPLSSTILGSWELTFEFLSPLWLGPCLMERCVGVIAFKHTCFFFCFSR